MTERCEKKCKTEPVEELNLDVLYSETNPSPKLLRAVIESNATEHITSVMCSYFPRGSMDVLLTSFPNINSFTCHYGGVLSRNLQNPELKLLMKTAGPRLRKLCIKPSQDTGDGSRVPRIKFQGCGYRWIAKHATALNFLEISLCNDIKQQLIARLKTSALETLILYDAKNNLNMDDLKCLLGRSPNLKHLHVYGSTPQQKDCERGMKKSDTELKGLRLNSEHDENDFISDLKKQFSNVSDILFFEM